MANKDKKTNYDYVKEQWISGLKANIARLERRIEKVKELPIDNFVNWSVIEKGCSTEIYFSLDPMLKMTGAYNQELIRQLYKAFLLMEFTNEFGVVPVPPLIDDFE